MSPREAVRLARPGSPARVPERRYGLAEPTRPSPTAHRRRSRWHTILPSLFLGAQVPLELACSQLPVDAVLPGLEIPTRSTPHAADSNNEQLRHNTALGSRLTFLSSRGRKAAVPFVGGRMGGRGEAGGHMVRSEGSCHHHRDPSALFPPPSLSSFRSTTGRTTPSTK